MGCVTYIYIYIYIHKRWAVLLGIWLLGNIFGVWIAKPSGCHCTDGPLTSRVFTEDQTIS